jgi:hypothetical protein
MSDQPETVYRRVECQLPPSKCFEAGHLRLAQWPLAPNGGCAVPISPPPLRETVYRRVWHTPYGYEPITPNPFDEIERLKGLLRESCDYLGDQYGDWSMTGRIDAAPKAPQEAGAS